MSEGNNGRVPPAEALRRLKVFSSELPAQGTPPSRCAEWEAALAKLEALLDELHLSPASGTAGEPAAAAAGLEREGYLVTDTRGLIVEANQAAADLLHSRKDFLHSMPLPLFVTEGQRAPFYALLSRLQTGRGMLRDWQVRFRAPGNATAILAVSVAASRGALGAVELHWVLRDASGAFWAERALRTEKAFSDILVDAAQAIVLVLDGRGRLQRCNPYLRAVSGHEPAEVLGREWTRLLPPGDRHAAWDIVWRATALGVSKSFTGGLLTRSEARRTVVWSAKALPRAEAGGEAVLVLGHDITELQESQRLAMQAERLAVIGQVTAALAHESRNLLQSSQACLERLSWRLADRPPALDLVHRVQKAQKDLARLFDDVQSYAAPLRLECVPCRLDEVWQEAWARVSASAEKEASLGEAAAGVNLWCTADPFRLGQVFRNIFENALAACPSPVRIEVACGEGNVAGRPAVRVAVRDNGPGLSVEQRQRIFEAFYTTKARGSGLGMAIARRIMEVHGGQIAVGDGGPPGAEIILLLPRNQT